MNKNVIAIKLCKDRSDWELCQHDRIISPETRPVTIKGYTNIQKFACSELTNLHNAHFLIVGSFSQIEANIYELHSIILSKASGSSALSFHTPGRDESSQSTLWDIVPCYHLSDSTSLGDLVDHVQNASGIVQVTLLDLQSRFLGVPSSSSFTTPLGRSKAKEKEKESSPMSGRSMRVLGIFISVLGIAAVAVAFTVLNAATLGIAGLVVAGVGAAATLAGLGFFAAGYMKRNSGNQYRSFIDEPKSLQPM